MVGSASDQDESIHVRLRRLQVEHAVLRTIIRQAATKLMDVPGMASHNKAVDTIRKAAKEIGDGN